MERRIDVLASRLRDRRSGRVIFLSHCLLDENARYLGGAGRPAAVREVVDRCLDADLGIVQMPCPEELAWGGVRKRRMLRLVGRRVARSAVLARAAVVFTRAIQRRLARRVASQIADRLRAGIDVVAVVAIDGSPSCGLHRTLDLSGALKAMATLRPDTITPPEQDALLRATARSGPGIFVEALAGELSRRRLEVPFLGHDLFAELDGEASSVRPDETTKEATVYERPYAITLRLGAVGQDEAIGRARKALEAEGFGILSDIDVSGTIEKRLGRKRAPYRILGACNPTYADRALDTEPAIGVFLPCNVDVFEGDDGATWVQAVKPEAMLRFVDNPELLPIAREVGAHLQRAIESLRA